MKICFFLQRRFAYIGHALACDLKEMLGDAEFCGIVQMRSSLKFLKEQKDIRYTSLLLEADIHTKLFEETIDYEYLKKIEARYGDPNLWPYLYVDRIIMNGQLKREYPYDSPLLSREEMLKRVQVTAREIIAFLDREKPDVVVCSVVGSVAALLLWNIAKKRGIPTLIIDTVRTGNRLAVSESYHTLTSVRERFRELQNGVSSQALPDAKQLLDSFRAKPSVYIPQYAPSHNRQAHRLSNLRFLTPRHLLWSITWHLRVFMRQLSEKDRDYDKILVWWQAWDKLKRKVRGLRGYEKFYHRPRAAERYAYYPLQQEPETSILLFTPYHTNQLDFIRAAAHALPIDMLLYVKEHPLMVGWRRRGYYEDMLKIPNVRLLDPRQTSFDIVKGAQLIFTIVGTVGWESVLFGKPVITFGRTFFNDVPFVKQCGDFNELPYLVKEQLEHFKHDETTLLNYLSALIEDSVAVDYYQFWESGAPFESMRKDEGMHALSQLLAKKIRLVTKNAQ